LRIQKNHRHFCASLLVFENNVKPLNHKSRNSLADAAKIWYPNRVILRAQWVVPISSPPIENGAVEIRRDRIVTVGPARDLLKKCRKREVRDLGEVALLPGLINAHCHLDYTDMVGQLWPSRSFLHWLDQIVALKGTWDLEDYLRSWRRGESLLLKNGVTTVADMEAVAANLLLAHTSPLRIWSFLEMINIGRERETAALLTQADFATRRIRPRGGYGLCPHSLYTASSGLIRKAATKCQARNWPMTIHLAESREEWEMFRRKRGAMFERFQSVGRKMTDCNGQTPTQALARLGVLRQSPLIAHANYVTDEDIALLARHRVSIVHCPKCHAYFGHHQFPVEKFLAKGVNVCLGTDSLASNDALDLFAEMRALWKAHPRLHPETLLKMATENGARALQQEQNCGTLEAGRWADLIAVPVRGPHLWEAILDSRPPVSLAWIGGKERN
jgi:cytosine/adenosine deaminase-related metal-dependent hydrolase